MKAVHKSIIRVPIPADLLSFYAAARAKHHQPATFAAIFSQSQFNWDAHHRKSWLDRATKWAEESGHEPPLMAYARTDWDAGQTIIQVNWTDGDAALMFKLSRDDD